MSDPLDYARLTEFCAAPDASAWLDALTAIPQGHLRATLLAHAAALAGVEAETARIVAPPPPPATPEPAGDWRAQLSAGPMLAGDTASLELRCVERRLRGEDVHQIADAEDLDASLVNFWLVTAQARGVRFPPLGDAPPFDAPDLTRRTLMKGKLPWRVAALRLQTDDLAEIADTLGVQRNTVASVVWAVRRGGVVFPNDRPHRRHPAVEARFPEEANRAPHHDAETPQDADRRAPARAPERE